MRVRGRVAGVAITKFHDWYVSHNLSSLLRSRCFGRHTKIQTTFLSRNLPITAIVPFSRTFSCQICPLKLVQSDNVFIFASHGGNFTNEHANFRP